MYQLFFTNDMDNSFCFSPLSKIIGVEVIPMNIGDKIKELRLKKEWTQEQLAQLLNVSRPTVSSWEVGRNYPDLETIIAISDLFRISLDKLLREDKEMAKETTKKIKRGTVYKRALIVVGVLFLFYAGYNMKLRFNEHTYRSHLEKNGWEQVSTGDSVEEDNFYELTENGVDYWTYVLPAGLLGIPLSEHKDPTLVTNKDDFIIRLNSEDKIKINISPENDPAFKKQIYVQTNIDGELVESKENWSEDYKEKINHYLSEYQDIHTELINKALDKRQEIFGS